jgi:hypothetical protein
MMKKLFLIVLLASSQLLLAQKNSNKPALKAINALLKSLTPEQKEKASFAYDSDERRNWFFIPTPRKGLPMLEMNDAQKKLAMNVVKATLSESGAATAAAIMQMELTLKAIEKLPAENTRRHPEKYFFSVFGTPHSSSLWGWRVEGHHISLNFDSESGQVHSGTPQFFGSNPAVVPAGYPNSGQQILKQEEVLGFELLYALTPEQQAKAIVSDKSPGEIFSSNKAHVDNVADLKKGINFKDLTADQQAKLLRLIRMYVSRYPFGFASEFMQKISKAGIDNLYFTWHGAKESKVGNGGHYYRIQNDVLFIEYENSQNNANHIHTSVRDLTNDFGEDLLRQHYKKEHNK